MKNRKLFNKYFLEYNFLKKEVDSMIIKGIQKITLLDYPGKIACTIFTGGCNFRCPFCQNASLVTHLDDEKIEETEIIEFLKSRVGKLDAVCISGGEPCIQKDLKEFCKKIKSLGFLIKLDTNGCFPEKIKELFDEHLLDYIAMDIKNSEAKYNITAGINIDLDKIKQSITLIKESNIEHEFRTTVVQEFHEVEDLLHIVKWVSPSKLYLQQFRDSEDVIKKGLHAHSEENLRKMYEECLKVSSSVYLRGI